MGVFSGIANKVVEKGKSFVNAVKPSTVTKKVAGKGRSFFGNVVKDIKSSVLDTGVAKKAHVENIERMRSAHVTEETISAVKRPPGYFRNYFTNTKTGKTIKKGAQYGAVGALAPASIGVSRALVGGPPPPQYYEGGDVWPNQDFECARIEAKAFRDPKTFVG
jgi:hypothetical protein